MHEADLSGSPEIYVNLSGYDFIFRRLRNGVHNDGGFLSYSCN